MSSGGYNRSTFGADFQNVDLKFIQKDVRLDATYKRGLSTVDLEVVRGAAVTNYDDRAGVDIAIGDGSFWIKADLLDFGSGPFAPEMHDQIHTANGDVYEVLDPGRLDAENILWSVPVVRVDYVQP